MNSPHSNAQINEIGFKSKFFNKKFTAKILPHVRGKCSTTPKNFFKEPSYHICSIKPEGFKDGITNCV